jgi:arsenate reductase-like glutaredoxin family protein
MMDAPQMNIEAALKAAQIAAQQNDRYLFVALLIITGAAIVVLAKWLASQYNKMLSQWREDMNTREQTIRTLHEDRVKASERYSDELRAVIRAMGDEHRAIAERHAQVMAENGKTMGQVSVALSDLQLSCAYIRSIKSPAPTGHQLA